MRPALRALGVALLSRLRAPCCAPDPVVLVVDAVDHGWMEVELRYRRGLPVPPAEARQTLQAPRRLDPAEGDHLYGLLDVHLRLHRPQRLPAPPRLPARPDRAPLPFVIDL